METSYWRDFDLTKRKRNIQRAFNREEIRSPEDFPMVINTPCYFGYGNDPVPAGYWDDPAVMVKHQEDGFVKHLRAVDDDTIPYFMPWFGTGVLASSFGCKVKNATGNSDDPGIISTCIHDPADIAHLKRPDFTSAGDMPRVLRFMEYAKRHSDMPVGLTDMNSPLCTAAQMCGYDNLFVWMFEEPEAVHALMECITDTFIAWVKFQKELIGEPLDQSNGLQGVWSPKGVGVWMSDDDLVSVGAEQYKEFVVPYYSRIFDTFGGGSVHFCGNGVHQAPNLLSIRGIRAINNSPMGRFETFGKLVKAMKGQVTIQIQDAAPFEVEEYYTRLLVEVEDLRGLMLATFVEDRIALGMDGGSMAVSWDPIDTAQRIVRVIREQVRRKLEGKAP